MDWQGQQKAVCKIRPGHLRISILSLCLASGLSVAIVLNGFQLLYK